MPKADPSLSANTLRCSANLSAKASLSTVKRSLRRNNLFGRVAARKPWLTGAQIRKRQVWCLDKIKWSDAKLKSIIYSDECRLDLLPRHRMYVRRPIGKRLASKYILKTKKFSPSIMVWGCIKSDGTRLLIRWKTAVDSIEYQRILSEALPQVYNNRSIFQQDGAPCHRSASTTAYFTANSIKLLKDWPPQSPDLNVIENLWAILKEKVRQRQPNNVNELWCYCLEEWQAIPQETIDKLYDSVKNRFRAVIASRGKTTKY